MTKPDPVPSSEELVTWIDELFDELERLHAVEQLADPAETSSNAPAQPPKP